MQSHPTMVLDSHVTEESDVGNTAENEVVDDPLSSAQEVWYGKNEKEYEQFMTELDKITEAGDIIAKNDNVLAVQLASESSAPLPPALSNSKVQTSTSVINTVATTRPNQNQAANSQAGGNVHVPAVPTGGVFLQSTGSVPANVVARPAGAAPGTFQFVMDPRVGFFVGPVSPISTSGATSATFRQTNTKNSPQIRAPNAAVPVSKNVIVARNDIPAVPSTAQGIATTPKPGTKVTSWVSNTPPTGATPRIITPAGNNVAVAGTSTSSPGLGTGRGRGRPPKLLQTLTASAPPTGSAPVVDLTDEERLTRPTANSNHRTYNNTSSGKISAAPSVSTAAVNHSSTVSSSAKGRPIPPVLNRPPPLTAIIANQPLIAPKPAQAQIRATTNVAHGNSVPASPVRLNVISNQIRPGGPTNSQRSQAVNNGPSASVNNGARQSYYAADSREMNFNKLGVGRTFPSLVVVAKPTLRVKEFSPSAVTRDRTELDQQVKELLLNSMTKLTEWLIQQGLVRSSQVCQVHRAPNGGPINLKLGIYSDASKFPHSGGYVWICEYCPSQLFVSVFSGSIFEGAPHPPLVLLKLVYHWACQTSSSNIVSWVKVESFYVKMFFARMRAICTAAVHENYEIMGGPSKRVEVGVISLGTAAQDGSTRNVKVEVLGVMDPENKLIRLRAVEPLRDGEKNYKRRFVKILEPLAKWVHKKSIILTDFTVDKGTLHNMGFASVYQVAINPDANPDAAPKYSNINVMNYLRRVVPRIFQNTLSLLSRQIIQQFLDELVWRERWGPLPSQAFNTIIRHIAEQTRANPGTSLLRRLGKISDDPFRDWRYSAQEEEVQLVPDTDTTNASTHFVPIAPAPAPAQGTTAYSTASSIALTPVTPDIMRPSIDMLPQSIREPTPSPEQASPSAQVARRSRKRPAESSLAIAERPRKRPTESSVNLSESRKLNKEGKKTIPYSNVVVGTEQTTSLQSYYYGTLEGDPSLVGVDAVDIPVLKCSACVRSFTNNILFMKHLILHAQFSQFSCDLDDVTQCKYCLKTFPTPFSMQTHLEEVHLTSGSPDICMICSEKFKDTTALIEHMHRTHVALEMPYVCHVCQFRSSIHRDLIDHFYEVHNNGEKMQCPFCLKTVTVAANGRRLGFNISFFLTHIQKHQRRSIAKKCSRCALWFVHKWAIREHLQRDHVSFKDVAGVKPAQPSPSEDIKMPLPPAELGPSASLIAFRRGPHFPSRGSHSTTYLLPVLDLQSNINEYMCIECKEEMSDTHYPGYTMCSRCRFATCCPKAMKDHMRTFHEVYADHPVFDMSPAIILSKPMYCVCGYSSNSGNCLAKHLAICERKSAYPSPASAKAATVQSASFPPLVTLDDVDNSGEDPSDKWLKAFVPTRQNDSEGSRDAPEKKTTGGDTHSMLNVLGLVRKPSTDESSLDKAPSDKEDAAEPPVANVVEEEAITSGKSGNA